MCLATSAGCLRVQAAGRLLKVQMMLAALLPGSSTRPDQPSCLTRPACVCSWVPAQTSRMCGGRALSSWQCLLTGQPWPRCCCRRGQTPTAQVGAVLLMSGCCRMAACWLRVPCISRPVSGVLQRPVSSAACCLLACPPGPPPHAAARRLLWRHSHLVLRPVQCTGLHTRCAVSACSLPRLVLS